MKFVPGIGESDFRSFRESGFGYVDKTDFIRDVLADSSPVLAFPRPHNFCKTTNLSALGYFLRKSDEDLSHLFQGLAVSIDPRAMAHFQKYPVVFITFKDVKATTFASAMAGIREQIVSACRQHGYLFDGGKVEVTLARQLERARAGEVTDDELQYSLKWLSRALFEHHGQRVVILIDEYDTPIQSGYTNGFFDDVVGFFRNFFSAA
jgi:hypothetical protein